MRTGNAAVSGAAALPGSQVPAWEPECPTVSEVLRFPVSIALKNSYIFLIQISALSCLRLAASLAAYEAEIYFWEG